MMGRGREYFHVFRIIAEGFQPLQQEGRFCGASVGSSGGGTTDRVRPMPVSGRDTYKIVLPVPAPSGCFQD